MGCRRDYFTVCSSKGTESRGRPSDVDVDGCDLLAVFDFYFLTFFLTSKSSESDPKESSENLDAFFFLAFSPAGLRGDLGFFSLGSLRALGALGLAGAFLGLGACLGGEGALSLLPLAAGFVESFFSGLESTMMASEPLLPLTSLSNSVSELSSSEENIMLMCCCIWPKATTHHVEQVVEIVQPEVGGSLLLEVSDLLQLQVTLLEQLLLALQSQTPHLHSQQVVEISTHIILELLALPGSDRVRVVLALDQLFDHRPLLLVLHDEGAIAFLQDEARLVAQLASLGAQHSQQPAYHGRVCDGGLQLEDFVQALLLELLQLLGHHGHHEPHRRVRVVLLEVPATQTFL
ncbi:hypothetical protein B566_EDAN014502 [Ephemera danica]|nr:hypothetical protein B566_EDAN014502 [Ephemera danica]